MLKEFINAEGISTTIQIDEKGRAIYIVGKKRTSFNLCDYGDFTYYHNDGTVTTIGELALSDVNHEYSEIDPGLWQVILRGEELLELNNNRTQTRRHESYSAKNEKWDILVEKDVDIMEIVIRQAENKEILKAILSLLPQQQELINKVYFEGLSISEIARRDGVAKQSVDERLKRALKKVRKYFK